MEGTLDIKCMQNIIGDLTWQLWCIEQKRYVLIHSMKWRPEEKYASLKKMLKRNFRAWNQLRKALLDAREANLTGFTDEHVVLLKNLIASEEILVDEIRAVILE